MRFYYSTLMSLAFVLSLCLRCPTVWSVPSKRQNNDSMPNHQSGNASMAQHSETEGGGKLKMPEFIKKLMRGKQKKKDEKAAQSDARGEQSESENVQNGQNDNSAEIANMLNEMPRWTTSAGTSRNAAENISPLHGSSPNYYNLASGSSHQRTKSSNPNQQPADYESPRKKGRPEAASDRRRTNSNNDVNHSPQAAGEGTSRHGVRSRGIHRDGTAAQPPPSPARSDRSTDSDRRPSTSRRNAVGRTTSRRSSAQQDGPGQEAAAEPRGAEQRPADRRKSKSELANEFVESSIKMVDSGTKLVRQVASPVLKYIGENLPESERVVELGMSGANIVGEGLHKSGVIATDVGVSLKEICQYAWPTLCQNSQLYLWPAICAVGRNAWPITSSLAKSGYSSALWLKPRVGKVAKPTWRLCRKFVARPGYNRLILPLLKKGAKKMVNLPEWAESNSEPSEAEDNGTARAEEAGTSAAEHGETSSRFWSWKTGMPKAGENKDKGKSQNTESRTKSEKAQKNKVPKSENGAKEDEKKPKKKGKEKAEIIEEKNGKEKQQKQKEQAKPKKDIFEELNQYETDDEEDKWA
ncbi:hypothetical protein niasHT_005793 [Heterodera trifolii]|uniref:Uncharacterized protein n=1 Tax=Heterodera trifolii TaxID=157864 RepID=A0ABD2LTK8_9BILA